MHRLSEIRISRTASLRSGRRNRYIGISLSLLLLISGTAAGAEFSGSAESDSWNGAAASIATSALHKHVAALADDTFEGREAGARGGRAAAGYLVGQLEKFSIKPAGENGSYVQVFGNGYRNVLVLLEGTDPELNDEIVVIGAHYDHVGYGRNGNSYGPTGYIHNGADDNASGTAALLEIVAALSRHELRPRRTILFVFWDAEEKGLLGSKHWARQPTVPLENVVFYINLDMIGRLRDDRILVYGVRSGSGLRRLVSRVNEPSNFLIDFSWELKENSDHWPFVTRNIPVLMPHTDKHDDYHRPSDDVERINAAGIERTARFTFRLLHELVMQDEIPRYRPAWRYESESTRRHAEQRLSPMAGRLGVGWDASREDDAPLIVTHVTPGSAAEQAGVRAGDALLGVGDYAITSEAALRAAVLAVEAETVLRIERPGEPTPRELRCRLAGRPVRLGFSWRHDSAAPDVAFVSRVVAGSAADRAGMAAGDRIYSLDGRPLPAAEQCTELFAEAPFPLELVLERAGRLRTVVLKEYPFERLEKSPEPHSAAAEREVEATDR